MSHKLQLFKLPVFCNLVFFQNGNKQLKFIRYFIVYVYSKIISSVSFCTKIVKFIFMQADNLKSEIRQNIDCKILQTTLFRFTLSVTVCEAEIADFVRLRTAHVPEMDRQIIVVQQDISSVP